MNATDREYHVDDERLIVAYQAADRSLRLRHARVGSLLALLMIPGGATLDWFAYPDQFWSLTAIRLSCEVFLIPIILLLYTTWGMKRVRTLSAGLVAAPALMIAAMILVTDGATSSYYAGLMLMVMITCTLMLYTTWESVVYCCFIMLVYGIACAANSLFQPISFDFFVGPAFFLLLASAVGVTVCYYDTHRRLEDFRLRHTLDEKNRELYELDRLKSDFLANVSHELGTPLTLIMSPVEDLIQVQSELPELAGERLSLIRQNVIRLKVLIDDLLEIVRLESGRSRSLFAPLDLGALTQGLANSVRHHAENQGLTFNCIEMPDDGVAIVSGDQSQLERVILNLLTNAVKFTQPGGAVTVRMAVAESSVSVEVEDNGPGIPSKELPRVFERFHRVQSSQANATPGWGLGLAVAKELVEEHNGRLDVQSEYGNGATFTLTLPKLQHEESAAPQGGSSQSLNSLVEEDGQKVDDTESNERLHRGLVRLDQPPIPTPRISNDRDRLVIVDDEPAMLNYLVSLLELHFDLYLAIDGEQALDVIAQIRPQVVVLDMMLPKLDGLEVAKRIRNMPDLGEMRILMLTARVDERSKLDALRHGADDFVNKPFSATELKTRIDNLLKNVSLQSRLVAGNRELNTAIEQLKATQSQLIQSEKMNALGSLSGGLLHEILNPLNYGMMAVSMLKEGVADKALQQEIVDDIDEAMCRIQTIISDLRSFAHPESNTNQNLFPLVAAVDSAQQFTAYELREVAVECDIDKDAQVYGSQSQITQVFVNLLTNAAHSVMASKSSSSKVTSPANATNEASPKVKIRVWQDNGQSYCSVIDNGGGIRADLLSSLFDPFVTGKQPGEGMGLGLSICHTIIEAHDGAIQGENLEDEFGQLVGAQFTVSLPSKEKSVESMQS